MFLVFVDCFLPLCVCDYCTVHWVLVGIVQYKDVFLLLLLHVWVYPKWFYYFYFIPFPIYENVKGHEFIYWYLSCINIYHFSFAVFFFIIVLITFLVWFQDLCLCCCLQKYLITDVIFIVSVICSFLYLLIHLFVHLCSPTTSTINLVKSWIWFLQLQWKSHHL